MPTRILLADDHGVLRAGLLMMLNAEPDLKVVGEADSGEEAIRMAKELAPDVVLMDLSMPGIGGIEATRKLLAQKSNLRVLILTMHEDKGLLREAIRAGAAGYILKRAVKSELIHAIQVVMSGEVYVHPALTRALFSDGDLPASPPISSIRADTLTGREVDILRLIARGYTNTQVADELSISVRTVEYHRGNLMGKLNAHSRLDLVRFASEHGFLNETNEKPM